MSGKFLVAVLLILNLLVLIKVLSVSSFFSSARYQPDFDAYYHLVADLRQGINPYRVDYMQTLGPPLVFLYFFPFSLFSLHTGQTINLTINLVSGYLACTVLTLYLPVKNKFSAFLLLSLALYFVFTSRYSLQIGQPHLFTALLVALALTTSRFRLLFLSALFTVKTFFILPLISFFSSHKSCPGILIPLGIIFLSLIVVRPSSYMSYLNKLPSLGFSVITEPLTDTEYYNQSFRSTTKRLNLSSVYTPLYILLITASVVIAFLFPDLSLAICLSFLVSPILWPHYFIILFPIFVLFLFKRKSLISNILYLTSLILWLPDLRLQWAPVTPVNRLLASHFFFSLVFLILAQITALRYNSTTKSGLSSVVERFH